MDLKDQECERLRGFFSFNVPSLFYACPDQVKDFSLNLREQARNQMISQRALQDVELSVSPLRFEVEKLTKVRISA